MFSKITSVKRKKILCVWIQIKRKHISKFRSSSKSRKIRLLSISKFFVDIDLLKTAFWQTSIQSKSVVKISWLSDKDEITLTEIKKISLWSPKNCIEHLKEPTHCSQIGPSTVFSVNFWHEQSRENPSTSLERACLN